MRFERVEDDPVARPGGSPRAGTGEDDLAPGAGHAPGTEQHLAVVRVVVEEGAAAGIPLELAAQRLAQRRRHRGGERRTELAAAEATQAVDAAGGGHRRSLGPGHRRHRELRPASSRLALPRSASASAPADRRAAHCQFSVGPGGAHRRCKKRTPQGVRGSEIRLFGGEGGGGEADTAKRNQPLQKPRRIKPLRPVPHAASVRL
jgi:hypothetical protein